MVDRTVRGFQDISRKDVAEVGGKAANLGELTQAGIPVPPGFVLTTGAYRRFVETASIRERLLDAVRDLDPDDTGAADRASDEVGALFAGAEIPDDLRGELLSARGTLGEAPVAVRSSATAEDLEDASFAGQQETYLHVTGDAALLRAVRDCWASLWSARALAYRARRGIDPAEVALAVVVQEMVPADSAGVMFTVNPQNGRRSETLISAAWGLGEAVVSGQVDTDDLVVDTLRRRVASRSTADKTVMVVPAAPAGGTGTGGAPVDGGTRTVPVGPDERRAPVLDDAAALDLAAWGARITDHYGAPQDVEWARAGTGFVITQARPIVGLPAPAGPAPTSWPVPRRHAGYFRASIVEQMPDPLTPLFADLTAAHVIEQMIATVTDASGSRVFRDKGVEFTTINGYAYYGYTNAAMAGMTARSGLLVPRLLHGGVGGPRYWRTTALPRYRRVVEEESGADARSTGAVALLESVERLVSAGFAYYTSVQTVIPPVVIAESALTAFCRRVARPGDPRPETLLFGFESEPIRAEQSLYDLAAWAREHESLASALEASDAVPDERPEGVDEDVWAQWRERFAAHLAAHGHATYTLDLAQPVAADTPELLWDVLRMYLRGEGADPRGRREKAARDREEGAATISAHLPSPLRRVFQRLLRRAQELAPAREDALAGIGLGWPAARRALREIGRRLVSAGVIAQVDDVFWLRRDELLDLGRALDGGAEALPTRAGIIEDRRVIWRGQKLATPPQLLPERSIWHGFDRWMPSVGEGEGEGTEEEGFVLTGIGCSGGTVTAPVHVLSGPGEFRDFRPGEILVAAITTPAWTPLFAMAAGVITDVGGPLSHSSIVAREYGIPAVLGTGTATHRLRTGQRVRIDGGAGTVRVVEEGEGQE
ncbi:phosphoenolpyruvate synthase [Brachybacterium halotolerans subsp. kimchii]|uniref:PEP/pyruvate-binding domain-containing protein n=1 Tax=Brachybacterium halotolerans TaxID=2795215 RepID=UPI001E624773|nr:PEP/pyruvate-binding domain-containing protein [Brachybacterium halotolerans]UEJ81356.1 phosphoenolpyruvate synthase [Brachybacterium halotolerans subsp. kimchii]